MDQWQLYYMEMETEYHMIHVIHSHSIHMWDILNITLFLEISYKSYVENILKYIKISTLWLLTVCLSGANVAIFDKASDIIWL